MELFAWFRRRRPRPADSERIAIDPPRPSTSTPVPAPRPKTPTRHREPIQADGSGQRIHCELCDMARHSCVHGFQDRRARDLVFATRLGNTYHLREDCNVMTVPRAMSLESGGGRSRLSQITRGSARQKGLQPCRVCAGGKRGARGY